MVDHVVAAIQSRKWHSERAESRLRRKVLKRNTARFRRGNGPHTLRSRPGKDDRLASSSSPKTRHPARLETHSSHWGRVSCAVAPSDAGITPEGITVSAIALDSIPSVGLLPPLPFLTITSRFRPLQRRRRGPFVPDTSSSPYRLPRGICEGLERSLAPFRNRDAAFALAVFLGRHWSGFERLGQSFPICRRALANHPKLGLSEGRVKGAIATLERVGFIERAITMKASAYRATENGLRRKPIQFMFGGWTIPGFQGANQTAALRRKRTDQGRPVPLRTNLTEDIIIIPGRVVTPGKLERFSRKEALIEADSPLEQALERLRKEISDS